MKKRKNLETNFIRFIMEKYAQQLDNDEDIEIPEEEKEKGVIKKKLLTSPIDEEEEESNNDDEIIEKLLNEYKKIKAQYESRKIHFRRK